jgi:glutathione S-transferase
MITLYGFGPGLAVPDLSPFVMKAMMLLKLAGLDYVEKKGVPMQAPKGKLPYIDDDGTVVADSIFIRRHIEKTRGFDYDEGLTAEQRAQAYAVEQLCEKHLLWVLARVRWLDDANFERGFSSFFDTIPALARPLVKRLIRRKIARTLWAEGFGRYSESELHELGVRDVEALSTLLGDKPFLCGEKPCGADATLFGFLALTLDPASASPTRDAALAKANLAAYRDRMMKAYFPDFA